MGPLKEAECPLREARRPVKYRRSSERGVLQMHLRCIAAVPLIALDRAGEPPAFVAGRSEQGMTKFGLCTPESDPLEALAVVAAGEAAHVSVANDARPEQPCRTRGDARGWPAGAVRTRGVQCIAQLARHPARGDDRVEQKRTAVDGAFDVGSQTLADEIAESVEPAWRKRKARRHRVTTTRVEQAAVLRRQHRR